MQKVLIGILALGTAVLAIVCVMQSNQLRTLREQSRAAEEARVTESEAREAQAARVKELERTNRRLEQQVEKFATVTTQLRTNEAAQARSLNAFAEQMRAARKNGGAPGDDKEGGLFGKGMGEMLGKMMKDPAMRDMMRGQQKATLNMMYGGLFKEMTLAPEEKEKLMGILTEAQMKNIESAQGIFGGQKEDTGVDMQKRFEDTRKQTETELKSLLGDERFAQYEDYQKNISERMQLDQLKTQLDSEKMPLQDQQLAQLLKVMKEERAAVPPVIPNDAASFPKDFKALMTAENLEKQMQWMEDYDRRVLDRAGQFLTPDQMKQYRAFQQSQAAMQQFGLKMAGELFGTGKPAPAVEAVPGR